MRKRPFLVTLDVHILGRDVDFLVMVLDRLGIISNEWWAGP
jgi:hypothetical protein